MTGGKNAQVGFFDVIVLPLFRAFRALFPLAAPMAGGVEANYAYWKARAFLGNQEI